MSQPIIEIEGISKRYRIRGQRERYLSLRDEIGKTLRRIGRKDPGRAQDFWALKGVNFSVNAGEAVGIIGCNGAGKSTLLKILTRITPPTKGRITMRGRVASLLEVGTGFHPELTGRENVYLNGAILGMSRAEVRRKFDEIVAFSEVERFLDTPVKRYSSGMYVRLAFAVAAHLEPEILLVDEVLAVGDTAFQKKCLGKMGDVAGEGRTVVYVSHNMGSVLALCGQAMVLHEGSVRFAGPADRAVAEYLSMEGYRSNAPSLEQDRHTGLAGYTGISFGGLGYVGEHTAVSGGPLDIRLTYRAEKSGLKLHFAIGMYNLMGDKLLHLSTLHAEPECVESARVGEVVCHFDKLPLPEGAYRIQLSLHLVNEQVDHVLDASRLNVLQGNFYGTGRSPKASQSRVLVEQVWTHTSLETGASPASSVGWDQSQGEPRCD